MDDVLSVVNACTQTVDVYPESLKKELADLLPLFGVQRIVSLDHAISGTVASSQDGIEPLRRMGKWITNEVSLPDAVTPPWRPVEA